MGTLYHVVVAKSGSRRGVAASVLRRFESCQPLLVFIWAFLDCEDILQSIFLTNLEIGFKNVDIKIKEVFLDKVGK